VAKKEKAETKTEAKITRVHLDKTQTILFGADKEGKDYGPKHNPKRDGSKSAERFGKYKANMSIEAALKAGLTTGDIHNDVAKGFITLEAA
jgi:hypothetical protein